MRQNRHKEMKKRRKEKRKWYMREVKNEKGKKGTEKKMEWREEKN